MSKAVYILEMYPHVCSLHARIAEFEKSHMGVIVEVDKKLDMDFLFNLIDHYVGSMMKWSNTHPDGDTDIIKARYPWWDEDNTSDVDIDFYDDVIYPVCEHLMSLILEIIPDRTWNLYVVDRHLANLCTIAKHEDYRILDWHRIQNENKMKKKTLTPNKVSIKPPKVSGYILNGHIRSVSNNLHVRVRPGTQQSEYFKRYIKGDDKRWGK